MNASTLFIALSLALPLAASAQTKPTQQVTEVTEDLDPKTGKVIRRTTRTTTVPAGTIAAPAGTVAAPASTTATASTDAPAVAPASDAVVTNYFREKTTVAKLSATELASAYSRFIEKVRADRQGWQTADWANAANVLSSLNARYSQLRDSFSLDDKVTIRSQQAEFQALRTARQLSKDVSDKL